MNLKDRFKFAKNYLDEANKQIDVGNYIMARRCLADAYSQTRALLEGVQKLYLQNEVTDRPAERKKK